MAREEDDDLYDEEFDFVDDEDDELDEGDESDIADEPASGEEAADDRDDDRDRDDVEDDVDEEPLDEERVDEYGRPEPKPDYVVHVYEHNKFKRTIDRPFTPEDAEAFATEYNRTSKSYGRVAVTSKNDAKPKKTLD